MNKAVVNQIINLLQNKVPQGYDHLIREVIASAKMYLIIAAVMMIISIAMVVGGSILINGCEYEEVGLVLCFVGAILILITIAIIIYNVGVLTAPNVNLISNLISD